MAGSRSLAVCGLVIAAAAGVVARAAASEDDAGEMIGELYIGKARTDHPHWDPIYRKRSAPQPVRATATRSY